MICPKCGLTIEGHASQCPRCLTEIPQENRNGAGGGNSESPFYWVGRAFKKYAVFDGRARRKEYWFFTLFNYIVSTVVYLFFHSSFFSFMTASVSGYTPSLDSLNIWGVLLMLYNVAVFIPSLAVGVRRLHDTGRSGFYLLFSLIPIVGPIMVIVYLAGNSKPGPNQYGPNPKTP